MEDYQHYIVDCIACDEHNHSCREVEEDSQTSHSQGHTLVIARYRENIQAWLTPEVVALFGRIIVYNKGEDLSSQNGIQVVPLPNVGRESHTYMHHILQAKQSQSKECIDPAITTQCTVFCQGNPCDHLAYFKNTQNKPDDVLSYFTNAIESAQEHGFSEYCNSTGHYCRLAGWRLTSWQGCQLGRNRYDKPIDYWFEHVIGRPLPNQNDFKWVIGANFAVRNDRMIARSEANLQLLYDEAYAGGHASPEVAHFFERAWRYIFI